MSTNNALRTILRWQLLALAITSVMLCAQPADAVVLVVKSDDLPQYSGPISAFETALDGSTRLIEIGGSRDNGERLLKDAAANDDVEAVFALGSQAAYLSRRLLPKTPLVFAMVLDWTRYELGSGATGVAVEMPVDALFTRFKLLLPQISRIGVIHSERTSKTALRQATDAAASVGIELITEEVRYSEDVAGAYRRIRRDIDALWMLPDPVVISRDNFRYLSQRCSNDNIAFLAFSENFVRAGALLSISPDYTTMGSQAAVLLERMIEDGEKAPPVQAPIGSSLAVNEQVARNLGLEFGPGLMTMADVIVNSGAN